MNCFTVGLIMILGLIIGGPVGAIIALLIIIATNQNK